MASSKSEVNRAFAEAAEEAFAEWRELKESGELKKMQIRDTHARNVFVNKMAKGQRKTDVLLRHQTYMD